MSLIPPLMRIPNVDLWVVERRDPKSSRVGETGISRPTCTSNGRRVVQHQLGPSSCLEELLPDLIHPVAIGPLALGIEPGHAGCCPHRTTYLFTNLPIVRLVSI